jgi:MFS family permease
MPDRRSGRWVLGTYAGFACFGSFWGVWGASVPRIQAQAGVTDGELGVALTLVGAGALPAMLVTGRFLDRLGPGPTPVLVAAFGIAGAGMACTAHGAASLAAGLAVVGVCSGAVDVAVNTMAGRAEARLQRPVITRAHGVFSVSVVAAILVTALSSAAGMAPEVPFAAVAGLCLAATPLFPVRRSASAVAAPPPLQPASSAPPVGLRPVLLVGFLGALGLAIENAHQTWSAAFAYAQLDAPDGVAELAPASFAATAAVVRLGGATIPSTWSRGAAMAGSGCAAVGSALLAAAQSLPVAAIGLALAAAGTAILFPLLLGVAARVAPERNRSRVTSVVTTVSYLGFVLGPVYVGLWADAFGLRAAMAAVAGLGVLLLALAPGVLAAAEPAPSRSTRRARWPTRPSWHCPDLDPAHER